MEDVHLMVYNQNLIGVSEPLPLEEPEQDTDGLG